MSIEYRILEIDDDPMMRAVIASVLSQEKSFAVSCCASGQDGLDQAVAWSPDLVLCDIAMPGFNGYQVLSQLRATEATASIPVIFTTAYSNTVEVDAMMALGAAAVIAKPFKLREVVSTVRRELCMPEADDGIIEPPDFDFIGRMREDVTLLRSCRRQLAAGAMPANLKHCAHRLSGAAGLHGFEAVSAAASKVERAIIANSNGMRSLANVRDELVRLISCIEQHTVEEGTRMQAATSMTNTQPRLLIADDDPAVIQFLAGRCEKLGFQVDSAVNGLQLMFKARQGHPDTLIVDVNMPQLDGITAAAGLLDSSSKPLNVIIISAGSSSDIEERCSSLGLSYTRKGPELWDHIKTILHTMHPAMEEVVPSYAAKANGAAFVPNRPRVMVVDDDPSVAKFLASRLAKFGIDMITAPNATMAMRLAVRQKPSVIIADYNMPDGDAFYLLSRLRSTPGTEKIPYFVLTGMALDELTEQKLRREILGQPGVIHIFQKSFDIAALFEALEHYCAFDKKAPGQGKIA